MAVPVCSQFVGSGSPSKGGGLWPSAAPAAAGVESPESGLGKGPAGSGRPGGGNRQRGKRGENGMDGKK